MIKTYFMFIIDFKKKSFYILLFLRKYIKQNIQKFR